MVFLVPLGGQRCRPSREQFRRRPIYFPASSWRIFALFNSRKATHQAGNGFSWLHIFITHGKNGITDRHFNPVLL
jgi:hypothetical protein